MYLKRLFPDISGSQESESWILLVYWNVRVKGGCRTAEQEMEKEKRLSPYDLKSLIRCDDFDFNLEVLQQSNSYGCPRGFAFEILLVD